MKKVSICSLIIGCAIFAAGIYGILFFNTIWSPILLLLGSVLFCVQGSAPISNLREALYSYSAMSRETIPNESAFIARLFLSLSWIARNQGILVLEDFMNDKKYNNALYRLGKNMVIDGYDLDFIAGALGNVIRLIRERMNIKARFLRQIGYQFCFVGIFVGIAGIFAYGFRYLNNGEILMEGIGVLFAITAIALMLSAVFSILIPSHLKNLGCQEIQIQKQMMEGLLSLQAGDSYDAILRKQYTFISVEDKELLLKEPLLEEAKKLNPSGNYDGAVADIRRTINSFDGF